MTCPDAEALAALAIEDAPSDERQRLADHVVSCPACASDYRLLRELHEEAGQKRRARSLSRTAWLVAGLAAAAALVLGVRPLLRARVDGSRGTAAAVEPADGAPLPSAPAELAWPAELGARAYRAQVFAGDGTPVWDAESSAQPRVAIPEDVRSRLRPGGSYYWTVRVEGPVQRRRLGPFWFQLAAR